MRSATYLLVRAIHENQLGEPDSALSTARQAQQIFNANHNLPGMLRARFEETYALHRLSLGTECLAAARALQRSLRTTRYPWLQVQIGFELSVCKGLTRGFWRVLFRTEKRTVSLSKIRSSLSHLRGYGLLAELKVTNGNDDEAWSITREGVRTLWRSNSRNARLSALCWNSVFSGES